MGFLSTILASWLSLYIGENGLSFDTLELEDDEELG